MLSPGEGVLSPREGVLSPFEGVLLTSEGVLSSWHHRGHQRGASENPHKTYLSRVSAQVMSGGRFAHGLPSPIPMIKSGHRGVNFLTLLGLCMSQMAEKHRAERTDTGAAERSCRQGPSVCNWLSKKGLQ